MLVGMIFGAGIFALPYAFSRSGLFWGMVHFAIALFITIILGFLYGEVAYYARGRHRFTGYAGIFLGNKAKQFAFLTTLASYYGSLLVYGLLGGLFISNFFNHGSYRFEISILFFIVSGIFVAFNFKKIADINFYLTVPIFGFVVYLLFIALPAIKIDNFFSNLYFSFNNDWFLPYGIWIFALGGAAVIPEVRDLFSSFPLKHLKRVIWVSTVLCALFSLIFGLAVWGAGNNSTTPDALSGIVKILGNKAFLVGSLIGFLAVFTSFLALAVNMRNIFRYDYGVSGFSSWFFTVIPPLGLFLLGAVDFVRTISFIGALGLGTWGVLTILMARSLRKRIAAGDPGDLLKPDSGEYMKPTRLFERLVLVGVLSGAIYELWRIFN